MEAKVSKKTQKSEKKFDKKISEKISKREKKVEEKNWKVSRASFLKNLEIYQILDLEGNVFALHATCLQNPKP